VRRELVLMTSASQFSVAQYQQRISNPIPAAGNFFADASSGFINLARVFYVISVHFGWILTFFVSYLKICPF
jgi:hypothetical protein